MRRYLSFGGGVNSTALLLLLTDEGVDFEAVFVNHGTDYPETYAYVEMLREKGYPITEIKPNCEGFESVYDYSLHYRLVPMRIQRWCTDKFKIRPLYAYFQRPCTVYIGIDADEERRAKDSRDTEITNEFPLVDRGIGRQGCIDIIEAHGLPVPPKSGCYICPFQRRAQWVEMNRQHPDLWCKAKTLEQAAIDRFAEKGIEGEAAILTPLPLDQYVSAKGKQGRFVSEEQDRLWDDRRPCQCGL